MRTCRKAAAALACWLGMGLSAEAQYGFPGGDPAPIAPAGWYPPGPPDSAPPGITEYGGPSAPSGPSPQDLMHRQPMPEKFMKEMMTDNGPSAWEDERSYTNPIRAQFSLDYLFMWFRGNRAPALLTTGIPNETLTGSFSNPNTRVLFGNRDTGSGLANGFKVSFLVYVVDPEVVALETNYFLMEQRSYVNNVSSDAAGNPVIARPFFDPSTGIESARIISNAGTAFGLAHDSFTTNFQGAEANLAYNVTGNNFNDGGNLILIGGARWLNLRERYYSYDVSTTIPATGGVRNIFSDTIDSSNQFVGGQFGAKVRIRKGRSVFDFVSKLAIGPNFQSINASGYRSTTVNNIPPATVVDPSQGFYVRATNAGQTTRSVIAFAPEFGVNWGFELNDNIRLNFGYNFLYMNNVVRSEGVINRNLASNPAVNGIYEPSRASFRTDSTFWIQSLNLGLEFLF
ncbi:MAG: BBP7 family outer membrane beta-barrel protein [Gemmataceae bacterium]|nr:BBP7 family outer membrane beta-barrel protein [Gemmataceae bacterium]